MDFEGSEAGIVKNTNEFEGFGSSCWAKKGLIPGLNNRLAGLNYSGKREVLAPRGPSPDPRDLCRGRLDGQGRLDGRDRRDSRGRLT